MLVAIDIGNTNVVLGVFHAGSSELRVKWRLQSNTQRTTDEYMALITSLLEHDGLCPSKVSGVVISSVVTPLTRVFRKLSQLLFSTEPVVVSAGIRTGMPIRMENPKEVGADRIVNSVAAYEMYRQALIIVDFGTATTFDVVSADGCYLGGCIVPGIGISLDALVNRTDKLPPVEIIKPSRVIGKNTVCSIQSGIYYGYVGLIEGIVRRIRKELDEDALVIATGGLGSLFHQEEGLFHEYSHDLTLQGLKILYERNRHA